MRLWSVHPKYLDQKGLVALWREGLLAKKVLEGKTKGYKNHPQLERFKNSERPVRYINSYLEFVYDEAVQRGYNFDYTKIGKCMTGTYLLLHVTSKQLKFERIHLLKKLSTRDPDKAKLIAEFCHPHPIFYKITGEIEPWERVTSSST